MDSERTTSASATRRKIGDSPMRSSNTPTIRMTMAAATAVIMNDSGAYCRM
jgi:hypothetical protein